MAIRLDRADLLEIQLACYEEPGDPNLHQPGGGGLDSVDAGPNCYGVAGFVDVGAAMGDYSVRVKQLRPAARIFAVDALSRHVTA